MADRTYTINSTAYPSVTTILGAVLAKPALISWAARQERETIRQALLEVLTDSAHPQTPDALWEAVEKATTGVLASEKAKKEAADIGTAAHAAIESYLKQRLNLPAPEIVLDDLSEGSRHAYESFIAWSDSVDLVPRHVEVEVCDDEIGYAGRFDLIADVLEVPTLIDVKTSKSVWFPEMGLQIIAYRHAAAKMGMETEQGIVVRIPKTLDDPTLEAVLVPYDITIDHFKACVALYNLNKAMRRSR